jgi:phosphoenolpyruvate carboxykinase (ATP)
VLQPSQTWRDKEAYRKQALKLGNLFREAFREFENDVTDDVRDAGPRV